MNSEISTQLHDAFYTLMDQYGDVFEKVKSSKDWKNPFRELISTKIPRLIMQYSGIKSPYAVVGSYGKGLWTAVPWIAVFDNRITTSAQKGVYIVYLLNKDTKQLYLSLEIAATEVMGIKENSDGKKVFTGIVENNSAELRTKLEEKANEIRRVIQDEYFQKDGRISSGSAGYDAGTVYYKCYSLSTLPDSASLVEDLRRMLRIYQRYYEIYVGAEGLQESMKEEKKVKMSSIKNRIQSIKNYILVKGFSYPDGLIENFYLSLKSKPFVILAGTSGTGKTKLVKLFAEAIGATSAEGGGNGRYKLVSVRPDWSDSSDLFGHVNLKGEFVPGAVMDFIDKAVHDIENPYFLCLDEMNLARVEYYLSDFLSLMETRRKYNDEIITDEVILDKAAKEKYGGIYLPENLYIIGTVNMDETTFPFSKKVLDRANTIEFSYVDLVPSFEDVEKNVDPTVEKNEFLKPEYILLKADTPAMYYSDVTAICEELQDINRILQTAQEHVGYRVRDEIVFYMINNKVSSLLSYEDAMDNEIMQKILPRIQGSNSSIKEMLCELFKKFAGDYTGLNQSDISDQMQAYIDSKDCKYRKSAEKICYMMRRFEEDGFTSYWL